MSNGADNFYKSDTVTMQKVAFKNQFQMKVAGNPSYFHFRNLCGNNEPVYRCSHA